MKAVNGMKYCPRCSETKPISSYHRNKRTADGYQCYCVDCMRDQNRVWMGANWRRYADKNAEYQRRHQAKKQAKLEAERQQRTEQHIATVKAQYGSQYTALPVGVECLEYTIVNESDVPLIRQWLGNQVLSKHYTASKDHYYAKIQVPSTKAAKKTGRPKKVPVLLHNIIMGTVNNPDVVVDHKNNIGLDNRRRNLRVCTQMQNKWNSRTYRNNKSGYRGVYQRPDGIYIAYLMCDGTQYYLGSYETFAAAKAARKQGEKDHYGKYRCRRA